MDGLQYDPSDLIVLLLTTIKKAILENRSVPKSAKLIIFNADAIISLLHLYKWKGPQNRPKSLTFWAMKKMAEKPKLMAEVSILMGRDKMPYPITVFRARRKHTKSHL